ncbi:hypothetical protein, partial [Ramlibacter alkalitolerans]
MVGLWPAVMPVRIGFAEGWPLLKPAPPGQRLIWITGPGRTGTGGAAGAACVPGAPGAAAAGCPDGA